MYYPRKREMYANIINNFHCVLLCAPDLYQWAGSQCWHGGENQQPLHGGNSYGNPGSSGGWGGASLCCDETFKEEKERQVPLSCVWTLIRRVYKTVDRYGWKS